MLLDVTVVTSYSRDHDALIPSLKRSLANLRPAETGRDPATQILVLPVIRSYQEQECALDALCGLEPMCDSVNGLAQLKLRIEHLPLDRRDWWVDNILERLPGVRDVLDVSFGARFPA